MHKGSALNFASRLASIDAMKSGALDILIVGGGITGLGAALDAAARGLSVGLIEQDDLASGTSSKSSKMIHGGLRYLEQLNFGLVREALKERGLLLHRLAPHLVNPVPFIIPYRGGFLQRLYLSIGVFLYERLAGSKHVSSHRYLNSSALAKAAPALRQHHFSGGIEIWDAQEDDARYAMFVARTAAAKGARIATRVKAESLILEKGRVVGAKVSDRETGEAFEIRARHVATAMGPWTGQLDIGQPDMPPRLRPSKGVHIILPKNAIEMASGLIARTGTGLIFVIPWEGQWLIGDTDTEWQGDPGTATVTAQDVATILERLNSVLATPVSTDQILGAYAGVRPLVEDHRSGGTTDVSRKHVIASPIPGLTAICGGKYTTYRKMAEDLIDTIVKDCRPTTRLSSSTEWLPLLGASGFQQMMSDREGIANKANLTSKQVERLLHRYGDCIADILELMARRPELSVILRRDPLLLATEVVYACSHEGALHIEDVLERRTRTSILSADKGLPVLPDVAKLMQAELNWSDAHMHSEIARYRTHVQCESLPH